MLQLMLKRILFKHHCSKQNARENGRLAIREHAGSLGLATVDEMVSIVALDLLVVLIPS